MILNAKLKKTSPFFRAIDAEGTEERERGRENGWGGKSLEPYLGGPGVWAIIRAGEGGGE